MCRNGDPSRNWGPGVSLGERTGPVSTPLRSVIPEGHSVQFSRRTLSPKRAVFPWSNRWHRLCVCHRNGGEGGTVEGGKHASKKHQRRPPERVELRSGRYAVRRRFVQYGLP